mgnify:CR=1 FL=1
MRVLFLSAWFPYPPNNGSKLRIYNLLRGLSAHHALTLVTYSETGEPAPAELNALCEKVLVIPQKVYNPRSRRALVGFFNPKPRVLVDRHLPQMEACIRRELSAGHYDLVIASQWYTAAYLEHIPGVPAIFDEVEIGVFQDRVAHAGSVRGQVRHRLTLVKMRAYFRRLLRRFSAVTVVSPQERELLQGMVPGYRAVEVMPNGVDLADYAQVQAEPRPGRLIFTGSFTYQPANGWTGEDSFTYIAKDEGGLSSITTEVVITVSDKTKPQVVWDAPAEDGDVIEIQTHRQLTLEATATDDIGVKRVRFYRWVPTPTPEDPQKGFYADIANLNGQPYAAVLDTRDLVRDWNQIFVKAYDASGNESGRTWIWVINKVPNQVFLPVLNR